MPTTATPTLAHWMLQEIHEQPATLAATLARYADQNGFRDDTCEPIREWLSALKGDLVIAASGSSRHAGMVAEITIEDLSGIAVDVEYASEYCYRCEQSLKDAAVMIVSQSGETADTLAALRKAHAAGHKTFAITNVPASTMATEATVSMPTEAGRERAIPATKSFTGQLLVLHLIALLAAESRDTLTDAAIDQHLAAAAALPELIASQLEAWEKSVREVAEKYRDVENFLFLGRGVHYPIAREGALKLKESAYIHAEGYPSGELKHGPNALVSDEVPLVVLATVDRGDAESVLRYEKTLSLLEDMKAQGARTIAIGNSGDHTLAAICSHVIEVEETNEYLLPMCEVIPLQMFAYYMALQNGVDVDRPRNLVKSVVRE